MPASVRPGWGVLVAVGDKAKAAEHFDRSLDRKADVSTAALSGGDLDLCTTKTVVGRLLMNAEGSARAASQVADILIDVPSVSAKHAVIACDDAGADTPDEYKVTITDLSRHGVFVNGEKIEPGKPAPLARGDAVVLPFGMEYRFELPRDAPRPVPAPKDGRDGKRAQKTPGSKKKSAGTPGAAKRAKAASPGADEGGVALAEKFGESKASPKASPPDEKAARAQTQDALAAAKNLEAANAELRARLERAEQARDASAAELERAREAARAAARAAADKLEGARIASRDALAAAEAKLDEAEKTARETVSARDAAVASRDESRAALERALAAKMAAEKRAESAEASARDAVSAIETENAAHRKNLDDARAATAAAAQETREAREALGASAKRADALAAEKSALERALEETAARADAADTCAAPLRAETAAALARCKRGEDAARAMADRLAVARVAHAQAMAALNEVGARLSCDASEECLATKTDPPVSAANGAAPPRAALDATLEASDAEARVDAPRLGAETLEPPGDGDGGTLVPGSPPPAAHVGMDIMYETEPPSEMPANWRASSDPIPETEAAAAGGAEPEPALGVEPAEPAEPDEPAASEPASEPAPRSAAARRQSAVSSVLGGIVDAVAGAVAAEVAAAEAPDALAERGAEDGGDAGTGAQAEGEDEDEVAAAEDDTDEEADAAADEDDVDASGPEANPPMMPASAADKENVDAREKSFPASELEIGGAVPMSFLEGR